MVPPTYPPASPAASPAASPVSSPSVLTRLVLPGAVAVVVALAVFAILYSAFSPAQRANPVADPAPTSMLAEGITHGSVNAAERKDVVSGGTVDRRVTIGART